MTIRQLKDLLEQYDEDTEIRIMSQPSWPFEYETAGVWRHELEISEGGDIEDFTPAGAEAEVVYLVEGSQLAYGSKRAWDEMERAW